MSNVNSYNFDDTYILKRHIYIFFTLLLRLINQENKLLSWLAYNGPAAVAVNALSWQNYLGGVIQHHCDDSPLNLNHAIQVVGYDLTAEIPYYICKNSWGTLFGNKGYVHLAIGMNICGMVNEVSMMTVL